MNRQIQKPTSVHAIEAVYYSVTSWILEDLIREANDDMSANYQLEDVEGVSVRYNSITVYFKGGQEYEEEGGYDHEIDWKEPRQLRLWTEDYEEVFGEEEHERQRLHEAAPDLLAALERLINGLPSEYDDKHTNYLIEGAKKAIAKAKTEIVANGETNE